MQRNGSSRHIRNAAAMVAMTFALSGCLMSEKEADTGGDIIDDNELSGSVGDGPVVGAAMRIIRNDGVSLAELESDASANYNIIVRTKGRYYPLTIDARNGIDLVTNQAPDFLLLGAVKEPGKKTVANVNPFSTFAVEVARDLPGGINKSNLVTGEAHVINALNNGLTTLAETSPVSALIDASNIAEMVKASESLGETVRRVRDLQLAFSRPSSGDTVLGAVASDLIDGVVDGRGGPRVDARTSALAIVVAVQVLLESMQNELHVNGQDATAAMNTAVNQISEFTPQTTIHGLRVTPGMLDATRVGLDACLAVSADPKLQELRDAVAGVQGGMDPMFIRTLIPDDYRQTLDTVLMAIAGGSDADIDTINDVSRNGGTEPDPVNNPPSISGTPATSIVEGMTYSFTPDANDPDVGDTLTFSISGQPAWASFSTMTGELSGTPPVGTYSNIVISVSDAEFTSSLPAFTITVTATPPPNSPPTISGTPATSIVEGMTYSFTPDANDPDVGDTLTFSISGQPAWASFSTLTGELSGTPPVGTYSNIVISVSDAEFTSSLPAFTITVTATPPPNSPPTISGTAPNQVNAFSPYSFIPTASDPDVGDTLRFEVTGLPSWASFNTSTGEISGTPIDTHVGVYTDIVITVFDTSNASDSLAPFSITVQAVSLGSVTLNFTPPTHNDDGTLLTDLAGYKFYWGTTPGVYTNSETVPSPGISSYVINNLVPGTYEFVATSYNEAGVESVYSNPATKVVP